MPETTNFGSFCFEIKPDGTIQYANLELCKFLTIPHEKLLNTSFFDYLAAESFKKVQNQIKILKPQRPIFTVKLKFKLGHVVSKIYYWSFWGEFNKKNKLMSIKGICQKKEMETAEETAEREKKQLNEAIVKNMLEGVLFFNPGGQIEFYNDSALKILEVSPSIIKNSNINKINPRFKLIDFHERTIPNNEIPGYRALHEKIVVKSRLVGIDRPGYKRRWISENGVPLFDNYDNFLGAVSVFVDITDKITLAKELQENKQRLRDQFNASPIQTLIWEITDGEAILFDYNKRLETDTQDGIKNIQYKKATEIFWDIPEVVDEIMECYSTKKELVTERYYTYRTIAVKKYLRVHYSFLPPNQVIAHLIDLTSHKKLEEQLQNHQEKLQKLTRKLQSAIDEDLNFIFEEIHDELGQKLTFLQMGLFWLQKQIEKCTFPKGKSDLRKEIKYLRNISIGCIENIHHLLKKVKPVIMPGGSLYEVMEIYLQNVFFKMEIEYKFRSNCKRLTLEREKTVSVFRILQESITNIIRHSRATRISIELMKHNNLLSLMVEDNGKGFKEEDVIGRDSFGLLSMKERALDLGGSMEILENSKKGVTISVEIPLNN